MRAPHTARWTRRRFLGGLTLVGTAGLLGLPARPGAAEPPPETTRLRLGQIRSICRAPQYLTEEFLGSEGFTDVQYVVSGERSVGLAKALAAGEIDVTMQYIGPSIIQVDRGDPVVLLAGVQVGCFVLFGTDRVRSVRDLKGKTVSVESLGGSEHIFLASMTAYVGLDPHKDINWVVPPEDPGAATAKQLFVKGQVDAFLGLPPDAQEIRARKIGHVVVNSVADRPWSQYFCCLVAANRAFVRQHPAATKRALRAIVKATDVCAVDPERVARFLVEKRYTERYDYALEALKEIPYNKWREYDHEDTVRFYALRLHETGMIKNSPQKIIAQGTDWRFLNELKKELKG
jgi:NitT/TauT family transport system substrate-binding protein